MYQIDNSTASATRPASTSAGTGGFFTDGNPATGQAPTVVPAEFLNMLMMELVNLVQGAGLSLDKTNSSQVQSAIRRYVQSAPVLTDTGSANAYAAANPTPMLGTDIVSGLTQRVMLAHSNTGASTYSPDGLSAKPIWGMGMQPLQGGELQATSFATLIYLAAANSGSGAWILLSGTGGSQQVAAASQSQHAAQMGQVIAASGCQCRLVGSGSNLLLSRVKNGTIFIPGYGLATVPSGGVTLAPTGLTASTLYYIYAYMNGGTLMLEASTTARATDATTGIEIKNGDNTRLFVGMEYAATTTSWAGMVRSWYQDRGYVSSNTPSTSTTGSTTYVALASQKINYLAFAGETVRGTFLGITNTSNTGYSSYTQMAYDSSVSATGLSTQVQSYTSNPGNTLNYGEPSKVTNDGLHYAQLLGRTDSGTSTWTGGMIIEVQPIGR